MVTKTKKYNKKRIYRKKTYKKIYKRGGKPIKSGSYGCVFKPVLKCDKNKSAEFENGISKLMEEEAAQIEFDTILEVQRHIKGIPNNNDFIIWTYFPSWYTFAIKNAVIPNTNNSNFIL